MAWTSIALTVAAFGLACVAMSWIDRWHRRYAWRKADEEARRIMEERRDR